MAKSASDNITSGVGWVIMGVILSAVFDRGFFVVTGIGILIFGFGVLQAIWNSLTGDDTRKSVESDDLDESDAEKIKEYFRERAMTVRAVEDTLDSGSEILKVEIKGIFPVSVEESGVRLGYSIAVFSDVEDEGEIKARPWISLVSEFQEPTTVVFQYSRDGEVDIDFGDEVTEWMTVGLIPIEFVKSPKSGEQDITVVLTLFDVRNPPAITLGTPDDTNHPGVIDIRTAERRYRMKAAGYEDGDENAAKARVSIIKLGMAVAMADGVLASSEGNAMKDYIQKSLTQFGEEDESKRAELKELYNNALREAHSDATSGRLSVSDAAAQLVELGSETDCMEAVDYCFTIMKADGVVEESEMRVIYEVAELLDVEKVKLDDMLKGIWEGDDSVQVQKDASPLTILGIDASQPRDESIKELNRLFKIWNGRLPSLHGKEREEAQRVLDLVAEGRKLLDS